MRNLWMVCVLCAACAVPSAFGQRFFPSFGKPTVPVETQIAVDGTWTDLDGGDGLTLGIGLGNNVAGLVSGLYFAMLAGDADGDTATVASGDFWHAGIYGEGPMSGDTERPVVPYFGYRLGVARITAEEEATGEDDSGTFGLGETELGLRLLGSHLSLGVGYRVLVGPEVAGVSAWEWGGLTYHAHVRIPF